MDRVWKQRRSSVRQLAWVVLLLTGCSTISSQVKPGDVVRVETRTGPVDNTGLLLVPDAMGTKPFRPPAILRVSQCERYKVPFHEEIESVSRKEFLGNKSWPKKIVVGTFMTAGCGMLGMMTLGIGTLACGIAAWKNSPVVYRSDKTGRIVEGEREAIGPVQCEQAEWRHRALALSVKDPIASNILWRWRGSTGANGRLGMTSFEYAGFLRALGSIAGAGARNAQLRLRSEDLEGEMSIGQAELRSLAGIDVEAKGEPRLTPYPVAEIDFGGQGPYRAGSLVPVTVTTTNTGRGTLYQLKGVTRSPSRLFNGLEFVFGSIPPGEKRIWTTGVWLPKDHATKDIRLSVEFNERNGFVPESLQAGLELQALPRPDFAFTYQILDDGSGHSVGNNDGRLQKGEAVDLLVKIKNAGVGSATGVRASISSPRLKGVVPPDVENALGDIPADGTRTARFTVTVKRSAKVREIPLELVVTEQQFGDKASFAINLPLDAYVAPQILTVRQFIKVNSVGGTLRDRPSYDSPKIGQVSGGDALLAVGELGDWYKVEYDEGQYAWISKSNATREAARGGTAPVPSRPKTTLVRVIQNIPPVIVLMSPSRDLVTDREAINFRGKVVDPGGELEWIEVRVNGETLNERDIAVRPKGGLQTQGKVEIEFDERVALRIGSNKVEILAKGKADAVARKVVAVERRAVRGQLHAVLIGIDDYDNTRKLRYASADARAFGEYLRNHLEVSEANTTLLLNRDATARAIRAALGTELARTAREEDTVLIYYAGHGASEPNRNALDGDGFDKYLVSVDSDPSDLFSTAIAMEEFRRIFARIEAERVILIIDACFSGGVGGRTLPGVGARVDSAPLSEAFMDRLTQGKGRVILAASRAAQVAVEKDELRHGVFTYHLLKGLKGAADFDRDSFITIQEASAYVTRAVTRHVRGQTPVLKGTIEGELVIGRTQPLTKGTLKMGGSMPN